jgi:hypothetical protein
LPPTAEQIKNCKAVRQNFIPIETVKNLRAYEGLNVGDHLILKTRDYSKDPPDVYSRIMTVDKQCVVPKIFVVVHRDELGLTFARPFISGGKLGAMFCMEAQLNCRYEIDPAFGVSILLGGGYDPSAKRKEIEAKQKVVREYNKNIEFRSQGAAFFATWAYSNLKVGTEFWYRDRNGYSNNIRKAQVKSIVSDQGGMTVMLTPLAGKWPASEIWDGHHHWYVYYLTEPKQLNEGDL